MFILLNGPLGIGKSTLAEALGEAIEGCVTVFGDSLAAINPPRGNECEQVHAAMAALVAHHYTNGYRHFVVEHYWPTPQVLENLATRLRMVAPGESVRCFRLALPEAENRARIQRRQAARAIDDHALEWGSFAKEHAILASAGTELGELFSVSGPVEVLVAKMLDLLRLPHV